MFVSEVFGMESDPRTIVHDQNLSDALYGMEIEIEGVRVDVDTLNRELRPRYWRFIEDHSLRGGVELVFKVPLGGVDIMSALEELSAIIDALEERNKTNVQISHRTSVHLHIDFRDKEVDTLLSLATLQAVFEAGLYNIGGKTRYSNLYCPGFTNATGQLENLGRLYSTMKSDKTHSTKSREVQATVNEWCKYTSFNLKSLEHLGSVEIRTHEGSVDGQALLSWIQLYDRMVQYATNHTVDEILQRTNDVTTLARDVFGPLSRQVLTDTYYQYASTNVMNAWTISTLDVLRARKGLGKEAPESGLEGDLRRIIEFIETH